MAGSKRISDVLTPMRQVFVLVLVLVIAHAQAARESVTSPAFRGSGSNATGHSLWQWLSHTLGLQTNKRSGIPLSAPAAAAAAGVRGEPRRSLAENVWQERAEQVRVA